MIKVESYHVVTIDGDDVRMMLAVFGYAKAKLHDASYEPSTTQHRIARVEIREWIESIINQT